MSESWDWSGSKPNSAKSPAKSASASGNDSTKTNDELVEISWSHNQPTLADYISYHENYLREGALRSRECSRVEPVSAPKGNDCSQQDRRFSLRSVCNTNILAYFIMPPGKEVCNAKRRAHVAVNKAHMALDPQTPFEGRYPFLECRWSIDKYPNHDLDKDLEDLIHNHLLLCDWLEGQYNLAKKGEQAMFNAKRLRDHDMLRPTMRAITLIFWAGRESENESAEVAALVLTGDFSRMASGAFNFDSVREHASPGYTSTDRIVYLTLEKAVEFLVQLDRREVAANSALEFCDVKRWEWVRRNLIIDAAEYELERPVPFDPKEARARLEQDREERRKTVREAGFSERHVELEGILVW